MADPFELRLLAMSGKAWRYRHAMLTTAVLWGVAWLSACASTASPTNNAVPPQTPVFESPVAPAPGSHSATTIADVQARTEAEPAAGHSPLSEVEARTRLASAFRGRGFRIRQDVRLVAGGADVTLDGYDPKRNVGYEYIAVTERDTDFSVGEHALVTQLQEQRILVLEACDGAALTARMNEFLSAYPE